MAEPMPDDSNDAALFEHLRQISWSSGKVGALFLAAFVLVLWPTDLVVLRHLPEAKVSVAWLRVLAFCIAMASYLALRNTRIGHDRPLVVLGIGGSLMMMAIGWCLGRLGGPDQPWIHFTYPALFFTIVAPLRPRPRLLVTTALAVSLMGGYLLPYPNHWHEPMVLVTLSFVTSTSLMVVAVGHPFFRLLRQAFFQSRALERASRQLAELNDTLESRVQEQTNDLRRLTAHLERARESERTRIARELHDELGQELTALRLTVELTRQRFGRDPQSIARNLEDIEVLLGRTTTTARHLVSELRPRPLDDLGLHDALEWLVRQTEQRSGLSCFLVADDLPDLPSETSTVAFRFVQEALTNVMRHAKAKKIEVEAAVRGGELQLTVADDGVGMEPSSPQTGFGLLGIRERVTALSGRLEIDSAPGRGTILRALIPLREERKASS